MSPKEAMACVIRAAESYLEDLESGMDDGTYEKDARNQRLVRDLTEALTMVPC